MMKQNRKTHYEVLGLSPSAGFSDIKKSFISLAKKFHPDKNQSDEKIDVKFKHITEAYRVLSDSVSRYIYDMELGISPEDDVIPVEARIEEPTVTGNAAVDYVEMLVGGIPVPVLTELEDNVFEFRGIDDPLVKKAYFAGLYSFNKLSSLSMRQYYESGIKAFRSGKYSASVFFLLKAVGHNPGNLQYRFALGAAYEGGGQIDKAASEYREVIRLGGLTGYHCLPVREALINACMRMKNYREVKEQVREITVRGLKSISAENALKLVRAIERGGKSMEKDEES